MLSLPLKNKQEGENYQVDIGSLQCYLTHGETFFSLFKNFAAAVGSYSCADCVILYS